MRFTTAAGIVLALGATACAGWIKELAPRTSPAVCLSYTCPDPPNGASFQDSFSPFVCEYLFPGRYYFLCAYSGSGMLSGGDTADCPTTAKCTHHSTPSKRSNRQVASSPSKPRSADVPAGAKVRKALGDAKHHED